jgi:DNA primase
VLDDSQPKYLNTQETVLFNKRKLLFGLDRSQRAIKEAGYAIVVEGYMDAISVFGAGVENVVASLGTAFTVEHAKKLMRYAKEIYFCYDSDEAGQQATIRALSLVVRDTGAVVKVITVPDGKDPDEYIRKHGAEAFRELVKKALPLVDYRLKYVLSHVAYDTLEGKGRALQEIMPVLTGVIQALLGEYVKKLAQTLMIDEGLVLEELRRYRKAPVEMVERTRSMCSSVFFSGQLLFPSLSTMFTIMCLSALVPRRPITVSFAMRFPFARTSVGLLTERVGITALSMNSVFLSRMTGLRQSLSVS